MERERGQTYGGMTKLWRERERGQTYGERTKLWRERERTILWRDD